MNFQDYHQISKQYEIFYDHYNKEKRFLIEVKDENNFI